MIQACRLGPMLELTFSDYGTGAVLERLGCPLHYWVRRNADGDAPLLMFLHGAGVDHRMWASQIEAFAARHHVLTVDLRGHGQSRPEGGYSFPALVDDAFALLDIFSSRRVVLIGLSMGGNIAQEMVFRKPDRVTAAVFADCTCNTLVPPIDRATLPLYRALFGPMLAAYPTAALISQIGQTSSLTPSGQRYLREAAAQLTKLELASVMKTLLATLHHEPSYKVPIPELILHGSEDSLGNIRKIMPRWHARDTGSTFAVIPQASHCANIDNPGRFNEVVLGWIDRVVGWPGSAVTERPLPDLGVK
jgi:pimeloyl-ACP methyl ester carboxylesterase